jgi:hypothetical protein
MGVFVAELGPLPIYVVTDAARCELPDHVVVLGELHLLGLVRQYARYYNADRPHMSLAGDRCMPRTVEPPTVGRVVALPRVGGIHYRYARAA